MKPSQKPSLIFIVLSFLSFFLFVELRNHLFGPKLTLVDNSIIDFFYLHRDPAIVQAMTIVSFLGREVVIVTTTLLVVIFLFRKHRREAILFTFILIMDPIINTLFKNFIQRPRPSLELRAQISSLDYSFPSGHAMAAFVFYTTLSYFVYHFTQSKKLALVSTIFSILLIALIGFSRIYLGVHYPSDVVAGYLGGLCWFSSIMLINQTLILFKLFREKC